MRGSGPGSFAALNPGYSCHLLVWRSSVTTQALRTRQPGGGNGVAEGSTYDKVQRVNEALSTMSVAEKSALPPLDDEDFRLFEPP